MSDGLAVTLPVLVTISNVSGSRGAMFRSWATSDASIVMLDPVSNQKLYSFPAIFTGISGVPTAETDIGSSADCERNVSDFCGTSLNAVAHRSILARSLRSPLGSEDSFRNAASVAHFSYIGRAAV